ncbi:MAG: endonuclease/exonuclease/phosphatase family protein [Solirubrobacterales bacterium]
MRKSRFKRRILRTVRFTAISWNLFHGRDFPPDPALFTWRSRLLRRSERNATHVQVNRDLAREFASLLAAADWDVALLLEAPPRCAAPLARACGAEAHRVLTSRNSLGRLRAAAARLNPDLIASAEGGSNLTLVRPAAPSSRSAAPFGSYVHKKNSGTESRPRRIVERRELTIHAGPLERRAMALTRVAHGSGHGSGRSGRDEALLCVANLHASANRPDLAAADVLRAGAAASAWAGEAPLLFGGDLNLRPAESPAVFAKLRERFGLAGTTGPRAIDHLLARGLEAIDPPRQWPPERRELREDGLALRLSDHAPVEARFATLTPR